MNIKETTGIITAVSGLIVAITGLYHEIKSDNGGALKNMTNPEKK